MRPEHLGMTATQCHELKTNVKVTREPLDSGGYAKGYFGRYFGNITGEPLFRVVDDEGDLDTHIRASSYQAARRELALLLPNAKIEK